jgi:adenine-specific DNA-methyltransferase
VENHLNMLIPENGAPKVDTATLATFLNSGAADRAFRCISGSVAVSAYELEAMPVPSAAAMAELTALLRKDPTRAEIEALCNRLYGDT